MKDKKKRRPEVSMQNVEGIGICLVLSGMSICQALTLLKLGGFNVDTYKKEAVYYG